MPGKVSAPMGTSIKRGCRAIDTGASILMGAGWALGIQKSDAEQGLEIVKDNDTTLLVLVTGVKKINIEVPTKKNGARREGIRMGAKPVQARSENIHLMIV